MARQQVTFWVRARGRRDSLSTPRPFTRTKSPERSSSFRKSTAFCRDGKQKALFASIPARTAYAAVFSAPSPTKTPTSAQQAALAPILPRRSREFWLASDRSLITRIFRLAFASDRTLRARSNVSKEPL